jgi:SMODS-associated and fused to various effectors sensor domain
LRLESGDELRERLNDRFAATGMKRVPPAEAGFFYDDVIAKLHAQGRSTFDRQSFKDMCASEKLLDDGRGKKPVTVSVRSFMHPIDNLEARCDQTLNLVPHFDGRYIRDKADWAARVLPELRAFIVAAAQANDQLRLVIDAHVSLAFSVGALLDVKSGKTIEIEQRTAGRRFWSPDDLPADPTWPGLVFSEEALAGSGDDIAVAIGLTHDVGDAVRQYVKTIPQIGRLVHVGPEGGPSGRSVKCGHHAHRLAEAVTARLRVAHSHDGRSRSTHIFIAGPNAFAFFLGQHHVALGPCAVYEWDFEGRRGGSYSLGFRT